MPSAPRSSRWSGAAGCQRILVYTDSGIADPWLVAQLIIQSRHALNPLVVVQPVYMSPCTAADMVATLATFTDVASPDDLHHTNLVLERAGASVAV